MANVTTNVPGITFGPTGFVAPSEQDVLSGMQADIDQAFGGGLNPALETPQGQLASSMTAITGNANDTFVNLANQFDPAFAAGRFQDALGRIYFIERNPALPTVVQATCTGLAGVPIPVGALARAQDDNIYVCTEAGTIPQSGSIVLSFECTNTGPIPCPAGTLNRIFQAIPGWDSITNLTDGVLGNDVESREAFEERRQASVAQNSLGSVPSVRGAVLSVASVLDAFVTENPFAEQVDVGGQILVPNSLYVAAVGGAALDVATAIWSKKAPGCNYNGNTTVVVQDQSSGLVPPFPSYPVTFLIPPALDIVFAVNLLNNALVPSDAVAQIQQALMSAFAGADGLPRARIGSTILASRFYPPIVKLGSWAQILSVTIGSRNAPAAQVTGSIAGQVLTITGTQAGALAVGQTLDDPSGLILPGTVITAGAGNVWEISKAQNVAAETIFGVAATGTSVAVNINQVPTISADNISVTVTG
jgi:Baseplate J-like protein